MGMFQKYAEHFLVWFLLLAIILLFFFNVLPKFFSMYGVE